MGELTDSQKLGREAAYLHYRDGVTWPDLDEHYWPEHSFSKIRSAGRRYRADHPDEFPTAETPTEKLDLGVQYKEQGNYAEATANTTDIQSLAQLLKAINYNPLVWAVKDWEARAFSGWRGDTKKDLVFDEGRITGYVKDGGIITKTLWSVYAQFIKHEPTPIKPVVQPIEISSPYKAPPPLVSDTIRVLALADTHFGFRRCPDTGLLIPYHDEKACDIALQIATLYQPDLILHLGDLMDFEEWSERFIREPECAMTTQPALITGAWFFKSLRETCPDTHIVWIEGNHGKRLRTYIMMHVMHGYQMASIRDLKTPIWSIPNLLDFTSTQVEAVTGYPKAKYWVTDHFYASHGKHALAPGNTAKRATRNTGVHKIFGHTHRNELVFRTIMERGQNRQIMGLSVGCLCHTDGRVPGSGEDCQWQQAIAILEERRDTSIPSVELIPIQNGEATWRGQTLEGTRKRFEELYSRHDKYW